MQFRQQGTSGGFQATQGAGYNHQESAAQCHAAAWAPALNDRDQPQRHAPNEVAYYGLNVFAREA